MSAPSATGQDATWNSCLLSYTMMANLSWLQQLESIFSSRFFPRNDWSSRRGKTDLLLLFLPLAPSWCLADLPRPLFPFFSSVPASLSCKMAQKHLEKFQSHLEPSFRPATFQPLGWNIPDQVPFLGWLVSEKFHAKCLLEKVRQKKSVAFFLCF